MAGAVSGRVQLMFQGRLAEVLEHWQDALPKMETTLRDTHADGRPSLVDADIMGLPVTLFDSLTPHGFTFTPAATLVLVVDDVEDVDRLTAALGAGGDILMKPDAYEFAERFAWFTDRFGVSWQVIVRLEA